MSTITDNQRMTARVASALARVKASTAGAYLYLVPLFASLGGILLLREHPGIITLTGGVLVILGAYWSGS